MKRIAVTLLALFTLMLIMAGCSDADKYVAEVNGEKISRTQYEKIVGLYETNYKNQTGSTSLTKDQKQEIQESTLEDLIVQTMLLQEAEKLELKVTKEELDEAVENVKANWGGASAYNQFLEDSKLTAGDLRQEIEKQMLISKLANEKVKDIEVTDAEAKVYFEANPGEFGNLRQVKVAHILLETEKEASDVIARLKKGENFGTLAQKYSIEPAASESKGELPEYFDETSQIYDSEFQNAALALKKGEFTTKPVKTKFGYHVIKVLDEKPPQNKKFEAVKEQARAQVKNNKSSQVWSDYVESVKEKAEIKRY